MADRGKELARIQLVKLNEIATVCLMTSLLPSDSKTTDRLEIITELMVHHGFHRGMNKYGYFVSTYEPKES